MVYEAAKTIDKLVVQTVSEENILPASPTPDQFRIFKLSVLDQIALNVYIPLMLFYLNNNTSNLSSVILNRSKLLKHTLSQTLSRFYPFAGKVKDNLHIECNDEGVYYIETQVNTQLSDFLGQSPGNDIINLLIPQKAKESAIGNYVLMIQVNVFSCGGVAICTCINHKFIDGDTYTLFLRHWAAATRGSVETIYPSFTAPSLFPQISALNYQNPDSIGKTKFVSQRFVFDSIALAALKSKTCSSESAPTRFEVVAALLWKCFAKAAYMVNNNSLEKSLILAMVINLRGKNCVPKNAVGNLIWHGFAESKLATDLQYNFLVSQIQKGKALVNSDFVEVLKGDTGATTILEYAEMIMKCEESFVPVVITSMCNMGVYEHDFGEGKPIWFYYGNVSLVNFISICETRVGGGLEAVVSLRKEEMVIFENDPELLAFTSLNPAPIVMAYEAAKTTEEMIVHIVSEENIVPSSPTPDHLRIFKLSVLDHIAVKLYIPLILFFRNNNTRNLSSVIFDRSKLLKKTLSQTLSQFRPIAGKVKDDFHIDCNDEGVYYIDCYGNVLLKLLNTVKNSSLEKPYNLVMAINLRGKNCVPKNAVGNLVWHGLAKCNLAPDLEYHFSLNQIKKSKAEVNDEVIKGDSGAPTILKYGEMMMKSHSVVITTMCNTGVYELDFGWGKPIWFYYSNVSVPNFTSQEKMVAYKQWCH